MICILVVTEASSADVPLSGNDGEAFLCVHQVALGHRVIYVQKLFDFSGSKLNLPSVSDAPCAEKPFKIADLNTKALKKLLRRNYGSICSREQFSCILVS